MVIYVYIYNFKYIHIEMLVIDVSSTCKNGTHLKSKSNLTTMSFHLFYTISLYIG